MEGPKFAHPPIHPQKEREWLQEAVKGVCVGICVYLVGILCMHEGSITQAGYVRQIRCVRVCVYVFVLCLCAHNKTRS